VSGGTIVISILDNTGNDTLSFTDASGATAAPSLTAPGSLGASVSVSGSTATITTTGSDPLNVEQIVLGNLYISASSFAASGPITVTVTGSIDLGSTVASPGTVVVPTSTAAGPNQPVTPVTNIAGQTPVSLTFGNVNTGGTSFVSVSSSGPPPPAGFSLAGSYYDVSTTAAFTGQIEVCIDPSPASPVGLQLVHLVSPPVVLNSYIKGTSVCAMSPSLSPFALGRPKANQTITFAELANRAVGSPSFSVSAAASSRLVVTFAASGTCTVSGATVALAGVGPCTITTSQGL